MGWVVTETLLGLPSHWMWTAIPLDAQYLGFGCCRSVFVRERGRGSATLQEGHGKGCIIASDSLECSLRSVIRLRLSIRTGQASEGVPGAFSRPCIMI
jgi:hypothetical protein